MEKLHIWRLLLLLFFLFSLSTQRPASSSSTPISPSSAVMSFWLDDYPLSEGSIVLSANSDDWQPSRQTLRQQRKRGFSMLTRWKPFNSLSRQRTSIRNINRALFSPPATNEFGEVVSAETRAFSRPSGQPLRWG